jgi:hypothetical protein
MDAVDDRPSEARPPLGEQFDAIGDRLLLLAGQGAPPSEEFVGGLNLPHTLV